MIPRIFPQKHHKLKFHPWIKFFCQNHPCMGKSHPWIKSFYPWIKVSFVEKNDNHFLSMDVIHGYKVPIITTDDAHGLSLYQSRTGLICKYTMPFFRSAGHHRKFMIFARSHSSQKQKKCFPHTFKYHASILKPVRPTAINWTMALQGLRSEFQMMSANHHLMTLIQSKTFQIFLS